jgi:hypothetical protein
MAREVGLSANDLRDGFALLNAWWTTHKLGEG